jgi:hypothetical protein
MGCCICLSETGVLSWKRQRTNYGDYGRDATLPARGGWQRGSATARQGGSRVCGAPQKSIGNGYENGDPIRCSWKYDDEQIRNNQRDY